MDLGQDAKRKLNLSTIRIGGYLKHLVEIHHALAVQITNVCTQTIARPRFPAASDDQSRSCSWKAPRHPGRSRAPSPRAGEHQDR
jgi:hypothetical protein